MYKIGITPGFMYPDLSRVVYGGKSLTYMENDMAKFIIQKGILPLLIPDIEEEILFDLLNEMDGFVLTGGTDIAPQCYGETPILEGKWKGDIYRDQFELKVLKYALENEKPVLGICRGIQLLNVYFGGTLYQDTNTQNPNALVHRDAQLYDTLIHDIEFIKGKFMHQLYGHIDQPKINSVHHQAIKTLGNDLEILAISPIDNIIEAIGYSKAEVGKVMAVQWHPEFTKSLEGIIVDTRNLFDIFLGHVTNQSKK